MRWRFAYLCISLALLFCLGISLEEKAYAYIDPGSGLLILQSIGGFFAGVLYLVRKHIKALALRSTSVETAPTDPADPTKKA
jgi:hypothetical protein